MDFIEFELIAATALLIAHLVVLIANRFWPEPIKAARLNYSYGPFPSMTL